MQNKSSFTTLLKTTTKKPRIGSPENIVFKAEKKGPTLNK